MFSRMRWLTVLGVGLSFAIGFAIWQSNTSAEAARPPIEVSVAVIATPPPGVNCAEGTFCGKIKDLAGGCSDIPCCPPAQTYCDLESRVRFPFPRIQTASPGLCYGFGFIQDTYCATIECGGAALCSDPNCGVEGNEPVILKKQKPVGGSACPAIEI